MAEKGHGIPRVLAIIGLGLLLGVWGCGPDPASQSPNGTDRPGEPAPSAPHSQDGDAAPVDPPYDPEQEEPIDESEEPLGDLGPIDEPAMMSEDAFLATYAQLDGVEMLDSGVMYRVLEDGDGISPDFGDWVVLQYRGTFMNGNVFDETPGDQTAVFELVNVIEGWQEVLPLMVEGDHWEIAVPSALAYGEDGSDDGEIGPNQPLIFEIKLIRVQ